MRYLLLVLLALVGYALYRSVFRSKGDAPTMRRETQELGLEQREAARAVPVVAIGGRSYRLVDGRCTAYRLAAFVPGAARWQLLQRAGTSSGALPPGWQLVVQGGALTPAQQAELARITQEWTEGFLELEGDEQGFEAFLDPSADQTTVWRVHGFLKALAAARP